MAPTAIAAGMSGTSGDSPLKPALTEALAAVGRALRGLPVPGMLIGGVAVIMRGVPRLTRDVDATVSGRAIPLADLVRRLGDFDVEPRIERAVEFADENQVLLLRHSPTGIDVDLSLAWLPFEDEAIAAAETIDLAGERIRVARAEDLIIYKAVAFRPQDQQDIERLLVLHRRAIDLDRVRRVVGEFAAALEEPERLAALEALIRKADPSAI